MKNFDEFSRPEEYISPMDKHFRSVLRKLGRQGSYAFPPQIR